MAFLFKNVPNITDVWNMSGTLEAFNGALLPNLPNLPNITTWAHMHTHAYAHTRARICIHKTTLGMLGRLGRVNDSGGLNTPHLTAKVRNVGNVCFLTRGDCETYS